MIKMENGQRRYYDRNGAEITEGCKIRHSSGLVETVYRAQDGQLCTDATNPKWIETGRAAPCEYGLYPITLEETNDVVVET